MTNLQIFLKKINFNYKLIPFYKNVNDIGEGKYYAPVSKEWKDTVYFFNKNNIKNTPTNNINIYLIIKSYFSAFFKKKFIGNKYVSRLYKRKSLNKIFISKPEIKYINNKAIITIYMYNRQIQPLYKNLFKLTKQIRKIIIFIFKNIENKKIKKEILIRSWHEKLNKFRKLVLKVYLNKYKFEKKLLNILSKLICKILGKNIEFNIINLKSSVINTDILTEILALKLRKKKIQQFRTTNVILNKAKLSKVNNVKERSKIIKKVNKNLVMNKYKDVNINYIINLKEYDLYNLLSEIYCHKINSTKSFFNNIHKNIFNSIKYKIMNGIRLEVKGRLTKRYRADRATYRGDWKGGLKNIDSSFKNLSVINYLGYKNSNIEYSLYTSKRRIGAYAVKGWIAGK